jgi:hypothetical protein
MVSQLRNKGRAAAYALLLCLLHPSLSFGEELVAGWEGASSRGYAFVSPMISLQRGDPFALVLRATASYLYYDFPEAAARTEVRSPGQALGAALRYSGPRVSVSFGPGYEIRQTKRRSATGGETRNEERGWTLEGNLFFQASALTNLSAIVSYGDANNYFWARAGVKRQISNAGHQRPTSLHVGAEITRQGNADAKSDQLGGLFEIAFPGRRASLQLRSGYSRFKNRDGSRFTEPYFGVGVYRAF